MDELRKLQITQLEMLKQIDRVCRENNIEYSLCGGTLLGAVRHSGFIPWDDDLDICMTRENYDKFINVWNMNRPEGLGLILQNKDNSPGFPQSFTKVRKQNTTFLQNESERGKYHTGIFIDIFPEDRIPIKKVERILFFWRCIRYQLYSREFVPEGAHFLVRLVAFLLLRITSSASREKKRAVLLTRLTKYNCYSDLSYVDFSVPRTMRIELPSDLFDEYIFLKFEDQEFMCIKKWHQYLTLIFGDYLKMPPQNEQTWKHHPIILDFEHNVEDIL